ncbi:uncharacterized protein PAC_18194 [Phialocephala subalpina]|uniref:Integrase catalytic domain-containing protein n=1 Tax=Phialocephala subalpina TaxID=576137 RepID=A0A1L7XTH3_9HELO|nr:uncharacterized protein PAC_18194 [Phialocephala subalpina]
MVDNLKCLRAQINTQDKDLVIHGKILIMFLQMSMDSSFDTTIEILNTLKEAHTLEKVQDALESKEFGLASSAIKDEIANAAGNYDGWGQRGSNKRKGKAKVEHDDGKLAKLKATGGCYTCRGKHYKTECSVWRQTTKGRACMASTEGKEALSKEKENAVKALKDSESESSDYPRTNTARFITKLHPANTSVEIADGSAVRSKGKCNIKIAYISQNGKQRSTIVKRVHYISQAKGSLPSVGELEDSGAQVVVDSPGKTVTIMRDGKELLYGQRKHQVWLVYQGINHRSCSAIQIESTLRKEFDNTKDNVQGTSDTADSAAKETISGTCKPGPVAPTPVQGDVTAKPQGKPIPKVPTKLLHARLGHIGSHVQGKLNRMEKEFRRVFRERMALTTRKLGKVHMDLWGPVDASLKGMQYMLTITDQATGRVWVYFTKDKKRIAEIIQAWMQNAKNGETERQYRSLRFDKGREFLNQTMKSYYNGRGIRIEATAGYHLKGDSIAERNKILPLPPSDYPLLPATSLSLLLL